MRDDDAREKNIRYRAAMVEECFLTARASRFLASIIMSPPAQIPAQKLYLAHDASYDSGYRNARAARKPARRSPYFMSRRAAFLFEAYAHLRGQRQA